MWKPSIKHEYYVHWLVNELTSKGLVCRVAKIGEEKPDIEVPSLGTAVNIELGKSDIEKNVEDALKRFEKVIVCSDSRTLLGKLGQQNEDERVLISEVWSVPGLIRIDAD